MVDSAGRFRGTIVPPVLLHLGKVGGRFARATENNGKHTNLYSLKTNRLSKLLCALQKLIRSHLKKHLRKLNSRRQRIRNGEHVYNSFFRHTKTMTRPGRDPFTLRKYSIRINSNVHNGRASIVMELVGGLTDDFQRFYYDDAQN